MNKEIYGIIYKITNLINGKVYIGQTKRNFDERYNGTGNGAEKVYNYHMYRKNHEGHYYNVHLCNSMEKYGFENFKVEEEIDIAYSKKELDELEIKYIKEYNSSNPKFGYNKTEGGESGKITTFDNYMTDIRVGRIKPFICLESKEIFISKNKFDEMYGKCIELKEVKTIPNELRNGVVDLTNNFDYSNLNSYTIYTLSRPTYNENMSQRDIPVVCVTTKQLFFSSRIAKKYFYEKGVSNANIQKSCKTGIETSDKNKLGVPLKWMYAVEYLAYINDYYYEETN